MELYPPAPSNLISSPPAEASVASPPASAGQVALFVTVPEGIEAGRQLKFTTPDGQNMVVTVEERVEPGGKVKVCYPPLVPQAPTPASVSVSAAFVDAQASQKSWIAYFFSLGCCFCCFPMSIFVSPIVWCVVSSKFFCLSRQEREQRPRSRTPAKLALITLLAAAMIGCLTCAGSIGFIAGYQEAGGNILRLFMPWQDFIDNCPGWAAWGKEHCPAGPLSCDKPTKEEMSMICKDAAASRCHDAAEKMGILHYIREPCSLEHPTATSYPVAGAEAAVDAVAAAPARGSRQHHESVPASFPDTELKMCATARRACFRNGEKVLVGRCGSQWEWCAKEIEQYEEMKRGKPIKGNAEAQVDWEKVETLKARQARLERVKARLERVKADSNVHDVKTLLEVVKPAFVSAGMPEAKIDYMTKKWINPESFKAADVVV